MAYEKILKGIDFTKSELDDNDLDRFENELDFKFPADYRSFVKEVDGCEGDFNGKNYAVLWRVSDLKSFNEEYEVNKYVEGLLFFGSDGGGEAFAFDKKNKIIVRVPFVGMEMALCRKVSDSFEQFLMALITRDIYAKQ